MKTFIQFINEDMDFYDNMEEVPEEFRHGLKTGDLIKFSGSKSFLLYVVGQILYPKNGNPQENGFFEYFPEGTPVAHPSMLKLHAIKRIEQLKDFKLIFKKD
jgi:hypothetical protein